VWLIACLVVTAIVALAALYWWERRAIAAARIAARSLGLAQRCHGRLPRRHPGVVADLSSDLFPRGAWGQWALGAAIGTACVGIVLFAVIARIDPSAIDAAFLMMACFGVVCSILAWTLPVRRIG